MGWENLVLTLEAGAPHVGLVRLRRHVGRQHVAVLGNRAADDLGHIVSQQYVGNERPATGLQHAEALVEDRRNIALSNVVAEDTAHDHVGGVVSGLDGGHGGFQTADIGHIAPHRGLGRLGRGLPAVRSFLTHRARTAERSRGLPSLG